MAQQKEEIQIIPHFIGVIQKILSNVPQGI
jgi:hypothetical protein